MAQTLIILLVVLVELLLWKLFTTLEY